MSIYSGTATTANHTLSLHDALPIWGIAIGGPRGLHLFVGLVSLVAAAAAVWVAFLTGEWRAWSLPLALVPAITDRKSTRLNSSHVESTYAVFCLRKKHS